LSVSNNNTLLYALNNIIQGLTIYSPTNAHNVKNVELLQQFKFKKAAPTCFGLQGNDLQGATAST